MRNLLSGKAFSGALLVGCSGGLVDASYRGEPLFSVRGQVLQVQDIALTEHPVRVALFWSPTGQTDLDPTQLSEQPAVAVGISFPAAFTLNVFEPPAEAQMRPDGTAIGVVLVYQDRNGDGQLNAGELIGGASDRAIVYTREGVPAAASPTRDALQPGFQLVRVPSSCGEATSCVLPLGAGCASDADCQGGRCFDDDLFPGGYCALPASEAVCIPPGAAALYWAALEDVVFAKPCATDADCRVAEGYACNADLGACFPGALPPEDAICELDEDKLCETDDDCGGSRTCIGATETEYGICGRLCTANVTSDDLGAARLGLSCATDEDCGSSSVCDASLHLCLPERPVSIDIRSDFSVRPLCAGT